MQPFLVSASADADAKPSNAATRDKTKQQKFK